MPYQPKPNKRLDYAMLAICGFVALLLIAVIGMAAWASMIKFWPYDMSLTLAHYNFELIGWRQLGRLLQFYPHGTSTPPCLGRPSSFSALT